MRPIDQKLKYQIDKQIKLATTGSAGITLISVLQELKSFWGKFKLKIFEFVL